MRLVDRFLPAKRPIFERAKPSSMGTLVFHSIAALERGLDGGEERFAAYYFAIYQCGPDEHEPGSINERRDQLRKQFPDKVMAVEKRFVLMGEPAWLALAAYYQAVMGCERPGVFERDMMRAPFPTHVEARVGGRVVLRISSFCLEGSETRRRQSYREIIHQLWLSKNTVLDIVKRDRAA